MTVDRRVSVIRMGQLIKMDWIFIWMPGTCIRICCCNQLYTPQRAGQRLAYLLSLAPPLTLIPTPTHGQSSSRHLRGVLEPSTRCWLPFTHHPNSASETSPASIHRSTGAALRPSRHLSLHTAMDARCFFGRPQ